MTQPKSHQKHPDPPLAKVAVFWDYESCRPAGFMPAYTIVDNIREACLPYGSITTFKAYVEKADAYLSEPASRPLHHGHPSLREQLQLYGVGLSYYSPSARSTMGERLLLVDMMLFALDNPAPSTTLILITAEELSPYAISALRLRHYKIVLITPQNNGNPLRPAMAAQANEVIDWAAVMSKGRRSPTESAGIGGASARSLSSPGSVSTVSSMQMSPTTHRITPSGTVSSGGTVVDQALVPRISPTLSRQSQTQPSQAPTSLTNPTPLFPSVISHNTFQPFRSSTFTPRTQSGLGRSWNPAFTGGSIFSPPPTQTHFRSGSAGGRERGSGGGGERGGGQERGGATSISLNTNAPLSPTDHGPLSAVSTSSSLASPTGSSNWTQSPPTTSTQLPNVGGSAGSGQGGHAFGPVGPSLSPTESIVRRPNQAPSSLPSSQPFPSVDSRSGLTTTTSSGANKSNIANTGGVGVGRGQTPPGVVPSFAPPQNFPVQTQQMPLPMHMPQPHQPIHTFPLNLPPHYNVPQPQHQQILHHHHQQQPSQGGGGHHHHPSSQGLPHIPLQHFELLINILTEFRNEGKSRPYRSKIGSELLQRDRMVYQRAGVNSFKDYVGYAEQIGLVRLGGHSGSPGKEWIELVVPPPPFIGGGGPGVTSPGGHGHGGGPISMMGGGNPNIGSGGGNMDTGGGVGGVS